MAASRNDDAKNEGPLELAGMLLAVVAVMITLIWLAASNKIVWHFTPVLRRIGGLWEWLPAQWGTVKALQVHRSAREFLSNPGGVSFFDYAAFLNVSLAPLTALMSVACLCWYVSMMFKPRSEVFRRFRDADHLMRELSKVFTGTAPILHIRKELASHKDALWARQRWPEDVLFEDKIGNRPLVTGSRRDPKSLQAHPERIAEWFRGLHGAKDHANGLRTSKTLGRQVVNLASDADRARFKLSERGDFSFADRFSDVGKVMFGMLCAHAFGGAEGVKDAHRVKDQLNNSARGAKHGLPNLQVAQWIFDKYRKNELAHKLFAVHHWEFSYLFELFAQAKRQGKLPDSEFRWLKPASRYLWYALNTVGRFTPHTESGAVFNHHAFERRCARRKRLPLRITDSGALEHVLFVSCAVEGLMLEYQRWVEGVDEGDNEWWKDIDEWIAASRPLMDAMHAPPLPPDDEAARQLRETEFDQQQSRARSEATRRQQAEQNDALMGAFGAFGGPGGGGTSAGAGLDTGRTD